MVDYTLALQAALNSTANRSTPQDALKMFAAGQQMKKGREVDDLMALVGSGDPQQKGNALQKLALIDPQRAKQYHDYEQSKAQAAREGEQYDTFLLSRAAFDIAHASPERKLQVAREWQAKLNQAGISDDVLFGEDDFGPEDDEALNGVLQQYTPEWADQFLPQALGPEKYSEMRLRAQAGAGPASPVGKLKADLNSGLITPEEYEAAYTKAVTSKPVAEVNVTTTLQESEAEDTGKVYARQTERVMEAEDNALANLRTFDLAQAIIDETGNALPSEAGQFLGNFAVSLGLDPDRFALDNISEGQQFVGLMKNMVLDKQQQQKGPQTENDRALIEQTVASLGNTKEARQFLIDVGRAQAKLDVLKGEFWRDWYDEKGSAKGAGAAWAKVVGGSRLIRKRNGVRILLPDFIEAFKTQNPGAPLEDIIDVWVNDYE